MSFLLKQDSTDLQPLLQLLVSISCRLIDLNWEFCLYSGCPPLFSLASVICLSIQPSVSPLSLSITHFSPSHSPPSSSKLCSFWMSRFYEWSDKEKGDEGQRGKERWRTDGAGVKKKEKRKLAVGLDWGGGRNEAQALLQRPGQCQCFNGLMSAPHWL